MSEQYQVTGAIKLISDTQTFPSGFSKREFVITTDHEKYPQDLKFEVVKDKCEALGKLRPGQDITVHFNLRGNEYNGKYYVGLQCWKWENGEMSTQTRQEPTRTGAGGTTTTQGDWDDDETQIPF